MLNDKSSVLFNVGIHTVLQSGIAFSTTLFFPKLGMSHQGGVIFGASSALGFDIAYIVSGWINEKIGDSSDASSDTTHSTASWISKENLTLLNRVTKIAISIISGILSGMAIMKLSGNPITFVIGLKFSGAMAVIALAMSILFTTSEQNQESVDYKIGRMCGSMKTPNLQGQPTSTDFNRGYMHGLTDRSRKGYD